MVFLRLDMGLREDKEAEELLFEDELNCGDCLRFRSMPPHHVESVDESVDSGVGGRVSAALYCDAL